MCLCEDSFTSISPEEIENEVDSWDGLSYGSLCVVNEKKREVSVNGKILRITKRQFPVLLRLMTVQGGWREEDFLLLGVPSSRVACHISNLRKQIAGSGLRIINTQPRKYRLIE